MKIIELRIGDKLRLLGYSGNDIFVYRDWDDVYIVKKQAMNIHQSQRLEKQYQKHLFFQRLQNNHFKVPNVLNHGFENGLFFYEYKFVDGESLIEHFIYKDIYHIIPILDKLLYVISDFKDGNIYFEKQYIGKNFIDAFKEKINTNSEILNLNRELRNKLLNHLGRIRLIKKMYLNHGDMTFDNILIDQKGDLWLIDYSGSFYPHYWLDLATLFQDIVGGWYEIKHGFKTSEEKKQKLNNYLKNKIKSLDPEYLKHHNFFMSLIFLRILPYTQNKFIREKVFKKFVKFVNLL